MSVSQKKSKIIDLNQKAYIEREVLQGGRQPSKISKELNLHRKAASNVMHLVCRNHMFHDREGRPAVFDIKSMENIREFKALFPKSTPSMQINMLKGEFLETNVRRGVKNDSKQLSRRSMGRYMKLFFV